ncbi:hypothetical protein Tco_0784876, partial [Tanacetum coccineum]
NKCGDGGEYGGDGGGGGGGGGDDGGDDDGLSRKIASNFFKFIDLLRVLFKSCTTATNFQ